ncbi:MAG: hypothetical protein AB7L91_03650 [Dehalococcoidia bacterium]
MLDYHIETDADVCDVCRYALDHDFDLPYEHALVRIATLSMVEDLAQLDGRTTRVGAVAVSHAGLEPGPVHEFDPRHWFWAMFYEPRIRVSLQPERTSHERP